MRLDRDRLVTELTHSIVLPWVSVLRHRSTSKTTSLETKIYFSVSFFFHFLLIHEILFLCFFSSFLFPFFANTLFTRKRLSDHCRINRWRSLALWIVFSSSPLLDFPFGVHCTERNFYVSDEYVKKRRSNKFVQRRCLVFCVGTEKFER